MVIAPIEHIEIIQGVYGKKARIIGKGVTVKHIVELHLIYDWTVEEIGADFDLTPAEIYAALAYYYDHKEALDQEMEEDKKLIPPIIDEVKTLLADRGVEPNHFSYRSDGVFSLAFYELNAQFPNARELLEAITGVVIVKDVAFTSTDPDETRQQRFIQFTFTKRDPTGN